MPNALELMFDRMAIRCLLVKVRATPGGTNLSPEMTLLLALAMFGDFDLFPARTTDA